MSLAALVSFVREWRAANPQGKKEALVANLIQQFALRKDGALLVGAQFAIRVNENVKDAKFSHPVVALKKIVKHDDVPIVACLLTPRSCRLLLANTTFVEKASHSSQHLTAVKTVGNVLGSNLVTVYANLANVPENFGALWRVHQQSDPTANLARIIAATQAIKPRASSLWSPSDEEVVRILAAPTLALQLAHKPEYAQLAVSLNGIVQAKREEILAAAASENVNKRGHNIERIITEAAKGQSLGDLVVVVCSVTLAINVKSKRFDLQSAPAGYNVNKMLKHLGRGDGLLSMLFVGVDPSQRLLRTRLVSAFDRTLLGATRIEASWSGRGTRGTAQFSRNLDAIWLDEFVEAIDIELAKNFLRRLISHSDSSATV